MWTDRLLALLSLAVLIVFLGILVAFVKRIDLTIVVVVVVAMACFDFHRELSGGAS